MSGFEEHQAYWQAVAERHDWCKPVHIIAIYDRNGHIVDSVWIDGLEHDIAVIERQSHCPEQDAKLLNDLAR
jgi:hypothetical protein